MRNLVGRTSHTLFDESTPGDKTWLRLHNHNHNPMPPCCQAFSTPRASDPASGGFPSACEANRVCNASKSETGAKH